MMTKHIRSIALTLAASLPLGVVLTAPAYAEDTGLVRYLNEQTRAQIEALKRARANATPSPAGSTDQNVSSLGIRG